VKCQCADRDRLYREYQNATENYSRAFKILDQMRGTMGREQYIGFRTAIDETRQASEDARAALDRHIREHG